MGDVARIYFIQEDANLACMRAQLGLLTLVADSQPQKRSDIDQISNDITCLSSWKQGHSAKAQNGTSTGRKRTKEKDTKSTKRRKYKRTPRYSTAKRGPTTEVGPLAPCAATCFAVC